MTKISVTLHKRRALHLLVSLLWLVAAAAVSSCSGMRAVTPANAPPDISRRMPIDDAAPHQGISIGGQGYFGYQIIAPSDGVVVFSRGNHVRIHHGLDSMRQDIYTEHFHVDGGLPREGDNVKRGQTMGSIGAGKNTSLPHYHFVVVKKESPTKFTALNLIDYWFGIDQHKQKLEKGFDIGPFVIHCFDPNKSYPNEPVRFTYPVKCR